jgi:HEAT repeat protein
MGATRAAASESTVRERVQELTGGDSPERSPGEWRRVLAEVTEALLAAEEWPGVEGSPKLILDEIVLRAGAPEDAVKRAALRVVLVEQLEKREDVNQRIFLLRELALIGNRECVPTLERLLDDPWPPIRHYALRALQANPSQEAGKALLSALNKSRKTGERVALASALGSRGDPVALEPLEDALAEEKDEEVAKALRAAVLHLKERG